MARVLIIYYSRTGNTEKMANLIAKGAAGAGAEVTVKPVAEARPEMLHDTDAVIIGSPTYYGQMAAPVKHFLDETVKFHGKFEGKVGAAFASAANVGGGNESTILGILEGLLIHGMIIQGNPKGDHYGPVSIMDPDKRVEAQCQELGQRVAKLAGRLAG